MYELLTELHTATIDALKRTQFNQGDATQRLLMALYATIIEQTGSVIALVETKHAAGVEAILRSCLEAHVDLINLANDPAYADQMSAHYHAQWRLVCREAVKGTNPFLAGIQADAAKRLAKHEAEIKRLPQPLTIQRRFEIAKLSDLYYSVYNSLCSEAHNNIRSLIDRHYDNVGTEEAPQFEIRIFAGLDQESFDAAIDSFNAILITSNHVVHNYLKSLEGAKLAELAKRRDAMAHKT